MMGGRRRVGFTLVEVVMTIMIMALLMGGLTSAVLIASHAAPAEDSGYARHLDGERVLQAILGELQTALWVTEQTADAISFSIPDRNGDGLPERLRYAWSGSGTKRLNRTYNGVTGRVLEDVTAFALSYRDGRRSEAYEGPLVVGAEQLVSSHEGDMKLSSFAIDQNNWVGHAFDPCVPRDILHWRPTRVRVMARASGVPDGSGMVSIYSTFGFGFIDSELTSMPIAESDLDSSFAWHESVFTKPVELDPNVTYAIVVEAPSRSSDTMMDVQVQGDVFGGNASLIVGDSFGSSMYSNYRLQHELYGQTVSRGPDVTVTRNYLRDVALELQIGDESASSVSSSSYLRNVPEQLAGWWESDFTSDPRLDHNGDGLPDWSDLGGSFTGGALNAGSWQVNSTLQSNPAQTFSGNTTVEVVLETTSPGAGGFIYVPINASGDMSAVGVTLGREWNSTQSLELQTQTGDSSWEVLTKVTDLPLGPLTVRLVADADSETVRMWINGEAIDTYGVARFATSSLVQGVRVGTSGSPAKFYSVSVRSSP